MAFLPANDAFCHIKEVMLRLEAHGRLARYGLINQIHDALLFECPTQLLEECIVTIKDKMERPSVVLVGDICPGGLAVEVGVSTGRPWNEMTEVKRP